MSERFSKYALGTKIALVSTIAMVLVTVFVLLIFNVLDIPLTSKLTLIQLIIAFLGLLVFIQTLSVILATTLFAGSVKSNSLSVKTISKDKQLKTINENLETSLKDLSVLYHISQTLSHTLEISELNFAVNQILTQTLNLEKFCLMLFDENKQFLEVNSMSGFDEAQLTPLKIKIGEGLPGRSVRDRRYYYIADLDKEPGFVFFKGEKNNSGSLICIPFFVTDQPMGVLIIGKSKTHGFSHAEIQSLENISSQIATAFDRSMLYTKTKELSVKDELTGVYNRRHFQEALNMEFKRAARFNQKLSILMIDMDYFKRYNDTLGHLEGDKALKEMTRCLVANVREVDTVARFGGEEFVIILPDTSLENAISVAEKLRIFVKDEFKSSDTNQKPELTISIGVSSYPQSVQTEEDLLNTADMALYQAKANGRNQVFYTSPNVKMSQSSDT